MADLLERPKLDEPGIGSPDDRAHYARKNDIWRANLEGGRVMALCGVMFEPIRDPQRFPVCEDCQRIADGLPPLHPGEEPPPDR